MWVLLSFSGYMPLMRLISYSQRSLRQGPSSQIARRPFLEVLDRLGSQSQILIPPQFGGATARASCTLSSSSPPTSSALPQTVASSNMTLGLGCSECSEIWERREQIRSMKFGGCLF